MFPISKIQEAFDKEGNTINDTYNERCKKPLDELEWYAQALKQARKTGTPF